jgi:hypothetical protein
MKNIGVCGSSTRKWFVPTNPGENFPNVHLEMKYGEYEVEESPYHATYYSTFEQAFDAFRQLVGEIRFPQTQKIQGLLHCRIPGVPFQGFIWIDSEEDVPFAWEWASKYYGRVFARPCPLIPRHGFVESREIHSEQQLRELLAEVKQADPDGEILLTSLIEADWNAIYTNGMIYIGRGHDGATAGKAVKFFPVSEPVIFGWKYDWGTPFVELVRGATGWITTQFRGGPKVEAKRDFIPHEIVVREVIWVDPDHVDALEWERRMKSLPEGVVVYHPGGSLTCHTAIHAIINKVPYITSFEPKVGDTLSPTQQVNLKTPHWKQYFLAGFKLTCSMVDRWKAPETAKMAIYAFHHLSTSSEVSHRQLAAFFAGVWARLGAALVLGEQRHHGQAIHYYDNCKLFESGKDRSEVYEETVYYSDAELLQKLQIAIRCMSHCRWHHQYGGKKWARCGKSVLKMIKACRYETLIGHWNNSVNLAHNGGWWFNKLLYKADFDRMGDDFATQLHIIPELVCTTEWIEQIQGEILRQKAHPSKLLDIQQSQGRIIKRLLTASSLNITSVLSGAINYAEWKYEEFGEEARWRFVDTKDIKLQFRYNHRHSIILNLTEEIRQQILEVCGDNHEELFTLPSLAGSSALYAPAKVYLNTQPDYKGHRVVIKLCVGRGSVAIVADSKW